MLLIDLRLTGQSILDLESALSRDPKPYMRERASAILQIGQGCYIKEVAESGLLKRRDAHTVGEWVKRYRKLGIEGLKNQPGQGRKPSFFPPQSDRSPRTTVTNSSSKPDFA